MGGFTNLFGNRESEKFADSWLETFSSGYFKSIKRHPEKPTVFHLVTMWGGHFAISKEKNAHLLGDETVLLVGCMHACLPHPECSKALALCMLSIEQPQVVAKHPKYEMAYGRYMQEIAQLMNDDNFAELNAIFDRLNPNCSRKSPFPIGGKEAWQFSKKAMLTLTKGQ